MKLADYLAEQKLTLEAFGALCGRSTATISRLSRGLHKPDWPTIEAVEKATGGKVQPNDWADVPAEALPTDPEKPAEAAA
jgi:transcriptional regulator with XRE-family HTH domain